METVSGLIWQTTRGFQEASMLLEHLGQHLRGHGEAATAERFLAKARELNQQASMFQEIAVGQERVSEENLRRQLPEAEREDPET